jgi:hypothetical protein
MLLTRHTITFPNTRKIYIPRLRGGSQLNINAEGEEEIKKFVEGEVKLIGEIQPWVRMHLEETLKRHPKPIGADPSNPLRKLHEDAEVRLIYGGHV